jgi:hypothetical protein
MHMNTTLLMPLTALVSPALSRSAAAIPEIKDRALKDLASIGRLWATIPGDLIIVVLWSTAGLVLTALLASFGFIGGVAP